MKKEITNERKFTNIVKWLYQNDGKFRSGNEWKGALIEFIAKTLGII